MKSSHPRHVWRLILATAAVSVVSTAMAACGDDDSGGGGAAEPQGQAAVDAALQEGGTITVWGWDGALEDQVAAFEQEYPNVNVKLENVGTNVEQYTKLENAIRAGSGAPDVAQIEFYALPQFALPGHLVDLSQYGFDEFEDDYVVGAWESAHVGEGLYGLPAGGGPMALFYNKAVFDQYGIEVPTTWDEYLDAARQLHSADPTKYITADSGDAGFVTAMIWQAGGRPFQVDGEQVTIGFDDEGTQRFVELWSQLLEEDLLAPLPSWSEEWFRALTDGTIATMPWGGWMGGVFADMEDGVGDWRVAPLPTYDGEPVSAEHGGSHESVLEQSKNPALAAGFVRWLNHEGGNEVYMDHGGLPATVNDIETPDFLDKEWDYFGGQQINQVIVDAANSVGEGWEWLPYQVYATTVFGDTVGEAYLGKTSFSEGIAAWQEELVEYGEQQGFEVESGNGR